MSITSPPRQRDTVSGGRRWNLLMNKLKSLLTLITIFVSPLLRAYDSVLTSDDIAIIGRSLAHFYSTTNPPWLTELYSAKQGRLVNDETNRVELLIFNSDNNGERFLPSSKYQLDRIMNGCKGPDSSQPSISSTTITNLLQRAEQSASLRDIQKLDSRFKVISDEGPSAGIFADVYPNARAYAGIWLPGYSADKSEAFFSFLFGPRHSPSQACYKLKKTASGWEIAWYKFMLYM